MEIEHIPWDDLRILLAVHRHRSLLAAGQALRMSTSTVGRRLAALEGALKRTLVIRTTTGTTIDAGAMELVRLAEDLALGLEAVQRDDDALQGPVRLSAGEGLAMALVEVLAELRRRHPRLTIELMVDARAVDLARREADVGVRTVRSGSAVLIERPLGEVRFGLYAARSLVELRLRTTSPAPPQLAEVDAVGFLGPLQGSAQSRWLVELGARSFPFRASSDVAVAEAVRCGHGIGVLPELVAEQVPGLVRLTVSARPPRIPVWLAFHRDLRQVPRVRRVVEAITTAFARRTPGGRP